MSGMAEVLALHGIYGMSGGVQSACRCDGRWVTHAEYRAHLEAELTAAGFGSVVEAKAGALEEAADAIAAQRDATNPDRTPGEGWSVIDHRAGRFLGKTVATRLLRARAAELRKP